MIFFKKDPVLGVDLESAINNAVFPGLQVSWNSLLLLLLLSLLWCSMFMFFKIFKVICVVLDDKIIYMQGGPHNHTIGGLAVCLKHAQSPEFKAYQNKVLRIP